VNKNPFEIAIAFLSGCEQRLLTRFPLHSILPMTNRCVKNSVLAWFLIFFSYFFCIFSIYLPIVDESLDSSLENHVALE